MKDVSEYQKDLQSIRSMMERSVKFISLSGFAGVLAGIYALVGAGVAYYMLHYPLSPLAEGSYTAEPGVVIPKLLSTAIIVLIVSLATGFWFSYLKARKHNVSVWTSASRRLCINLAIPLISGGLFILILLYHGYYGMAAPACLLVYGLALIHASEQTFDEVRYLGFCEIGLGLMAALLPGYGLMFWALGFGVLHIIYGSVMYFRYDK